MAGYLSVRPALRWPRVVRSLCHQASCELAQLAEDLRPSAEQLRRAEEIQQQLQPVVDKLGGTLQCYGSCSNGTFMKASDVDLSFLVDEQKIRTIFQPKPKLATVPNPPKAPPTSGPPPGPPPGPPCPPCPPCPPPAPPPGESVTAPARPSAPPRAVPPQAVPPPPAPSPARAHRRIENLHYRVLRLFRLEAQRCKNAGAKKVQLVNARVPVLKFIGEEKEVLCDISVNNTEGFLNSLLVRRFCETEPVLAPVVRLLKHWARCRLLGDRALHGFSTYTLILMAVHVLQTGETPLHQQMVQKLSQEIENSTTEAASKALEIWCQPPIKSQQVQTIFAKFFEIYSQPALKAGVTVSIEALADQDENDPSGPSGTLRVLCPLTKRDVQRCTQNDWTWMFSEISRAAEILQGESDLQLLFQSPSPAPKTSMKRRVPGPPASQTESNESPVDRVDDVDGTGTIYTANSVPPPPAINGRISME